MSAALRLMGVISISPLISSGHITARAGACRQGQGAGSGAGPEPAGQEGGWVSGMVGDVACGWHNLAAHAPHIRPLTHSKHQLFCRRCCPSACTEAAALVPHTPNRLAGPTARALLQGHAPFASAPPRHRHRQHYPPPTSTACTNVVPLSLRIASGTSLGRMMDVRNEGMQAAMSRLPACVQQHSSQHGNMAWRGVGKSMPQGEERRYGICAHVCERAHYAPMRSGVFVRAWGEGPWHKGARVGRTRRPARPGAYNLEPPTHLQAQSSSLPLCAQPP